MRRALLAGAVAGAVLDLLLLAYLLLATLEEGEAADVLAVLVMVTLGSPLLGALVHLRGNPRGNGATIGAVVGGLLVVLVAGSLIGR